MSNNETLLEILSIATKTMIETIKRYRLSHPTVTLDGFLNIVSSDGNPVVALAAAQCWHDAEPTKTSKELQGFKRSRPSDDELAIPR